jgi:hypothetical protein
MYQLARTQLRSQIEAWIIAFLHVGSPLALFSLLRYGGQQTHYASEALCWIGLTALAPA